MSIVLSASKLKVLADCSWLYYCKYLLRLPEAVSDGAKRGTIVHLLFELLLKPRHRHYYKEILGTKGISKSIPIQRFIRRQMKKEEIGEIDSKKNNNFDLIEQMIVTGLWYDFYCEEGKIEEAETEFKYTDPKGYSIRGFIDKMAVYDKKMHLYDYKSSDKIFEDKDLQSNVQALMYSLYARRVRNMDSIVHFIFLRHPLDAIRKVKYSKTTLEGFEVYLAEISKFLENFGEKEARQAFAADKPYPKKGEGFKGKLLCGYCKYPGHEKKTGEVHYCCSYKWPFDYYALINKETKEIIKTSFNKNRLKSNENSFIEKRRYDGCPAWSLTNWTNSLS